MIFFYIKRLIAAGNMEVDFIVFTDENHNTMEQAAMPQVIKFIKHRSTVIDTARLKIK